MDGWLCGDCKSLNTPRAKRCYRCNTPRDVGERKDEDEIRTIVRTGLGGTGAPSAGATSAAAGVVVATASGPSAARTGSTSAAVPASVPAPGSAGKTARARPEVTDARSSRGRSRLLVVLLAVTTAWSGASTVLLMARGGTMGLLMAMLRGDTGSLGMIAAISALGGLLTIATAIAWFVWFDRVLRNVPPLTGQWPDTGRAAAIGWWFVPIVGFIKAPRIVGDVYHRLSVRGTPGLWLLALWALCWIGGTIGPAIAVRVIAFLPFGLELYLQLADLISLVGQASYIAAGVFAIALVIAIEKASRTRRISGGAALEVSPGTPEHGAGFEAALRAAAEANAVAKAEKHGVASPTAAPYRTEGWPGRPGPSGVDGALAPVAMIGAGGPSDPGAMGPAPVASPGPAPIPVSDDAVPVLRPVLRPPAHLAGASAVVQPEGPAGSRSIAFKREIPVTPLDPAGEVLVEGIKPRRQWGLRLPRWALGLAGVVAVVAVAATVLLAGSLGSKPADPGTARADGAASPSPGAVADRQAIASPEPVAATPVPTPSPTPAPTPEPWIAARERLAADTFAEDWRGRLDLEGTLRIGDRKPATWALDVARDGGDEWTRTKVTDPAAGLSLTTEQVLTRRTAWARSGRGPWSSRPRGFGDQPTEALFGVRSAEDLTYLETTKEDGKVRFTFRIDDASDLLVLAYLRTLGLGPLERTDATVVTDADGVPLRAALTYAGPLRGGKARLVVEIRYRDVGGSFTIASPKDGGPVVEE